MRFSDLEPLTRISHTFLMQCGAPEPTGIVKWTGVRFTDFADMLGLVPGAHYCRLTASDGHYVDESVEELRHPQVMLVWMMNEEPLDPQHGAPLRLVHAVPVWQSEHQGDHRDHLRDAGAAAAGDGVADDKSVEDLSPNGLVGSSPTGSAWPSRSLTLGGFFCAEGGRWVRQSVPVDGSPPGRRDL